MKLKGLRQSHKFVADQQNKGNDIRWDGWDIVQFHAHPAAFYKGGVYRNGNYGYETRIVVTAEGTWNVPPRVIV